MGNNVLDESIGFLTGITYRKIVNLLSLELKELEITPEQWAVLYRISEKDAINQKDIASRSGKDQPTTTRILDALYKKGFIEKKMCKTDRRSFLVFLTESGREVVKKAAPIELKTLEQVAQGIEPEQLVLFKLMLRQMNENIENTLRK
ncbi:MAG TPA: MarR family transcriptional regulator [Paenibacillaceae bacterium]|nr:MarR family transcriptional regulator [Paenibacillaceae bacterium]